MNKAWQQQLQTALGQSIGCALKLAALKGEFPPPKLSPGEKLELAKFTNDNRRHSWLRARCALKSLLSELGQNADTTAVSFPHCQYSITHTADMAIAVARLDAEPNGIGIDLEVCRLVKPGSEKFFLAEPERQWLDSLQGANKDEQLIRLWTIKEAIFKSDLQSQDGVLKNYLLEIPKNYHGEALHHANGKSARFRYASSQLDNAWLTVSIPL